MDINIWPLAYQNLRLKFLYLKSLGLTLNYSYQLQAEVSLYLEAMV